MRPYPGRALRGQRGDRVDSGQKAMLASLGVWWEPNDIWHMTTSWKCFKSVTLFKFVRGLRRRGKKQGDFYHNIVGVLAKKAGVLAVTRLLALVVLLIVVLVLVFHCLVFPMVFTFSLSMLIDFIFLWYARKQYAFMTWCLGFQTVPLFANGVGERLMFPRTLMLNVFRRFLMLLSRKMQGCPGGFISSARAYHKPNGSARYGRYRSITEN